MTALRAHPETVSRLMAGRAATLTEDGTVLLGGRPLLGRDGLPADGSLWEEAPTGERARSDREVQEPGVPRRHVWLRRVRS